VCAGDIFSDYCDANLDWHKQRLLGFEGKVLLLGNLAHTKLRAACETWNWPIEYAETPDANPMPAGVPAVGNFWADGALQIIGSIDRNGSILKFVVVWHPSARDWTANRTAGLENWVVG
jgi:hypothetical protein